MGTVSFLYIAALHAFSKTHVIEQIIVVQDVTFASIVICDRRRLGISVEMLSPIVLSLYLV